ncbi:hypothetical protein E5676_scaffold1704G00140 [Cucumis melo var. makuwa]|uniref:Uncharacterized protein n=1 Tax=Cucumis melo var. makuwa TaxID=1194695 RepID=A0A5D3E440_CUCMM|nr:hypothetical protein E6C27_scaffold179G00620 [Cucumis melo var. makuwa]TYK30672.1 hypothetical protein E5676_scaffold1704G00140 [Cucumis melo var. makuwa]
MVRIGATKCTGQRPTKGKQRWASDDGQSRLTQLPRYERALVSTGNRNKGLIYAQNTGRMRGREEERIEVSCVI